MRYVNLKKRNTSKFEYIAKRLATASMLCLALTAVIVVPLTSKANNVSAANTIEEIQDMDLTNDTANETVCALFDDEL